MTGDAARRSTPAGWHPSAGLCMPTVVGIETSERHVGDAASAAGYRRRSPATTGEVAAEGAAIQPSNRVLRPTGARRATPVGPIARAPFVATVVATPRATVIANNGAYAVATKVAAAAPMDGPPPGRRLQPMRGRHQELQAFPRGALGAHRLWWSRAGRPGGWLLHPACDTLGRTCASAPPSTSPPRCSW